MTKGDALDPRGLIREAYRMEGITPGECRSVFLDWALGAPEGADIHAMIGALLAQYGAPDHPMTTVLREGLEAQVEPRRRGGSRARARDGGGD